MIRTGRLFLSLLVLALLQWQCKEKYVSPYVSPPTGYLVVEGFISGNGPTQYMLSRTIGLPGTSGTPAELKAKVQVEGNDNSVFPLAEQGNGLYGADALALQATVQYRLRIGTADGEQFLSDYVPYKPTPPIDSVNWVVNPDNSVQIYVNTHDPTNNTRYYLWNYRETWENDAKETSLFVYDGDTIPVMVFRRDSSQQVDRCWVEDVSQQILLSNSTKLADDVIYRFPINNIPTNNEKDNVLYSTLVSQYALTQQAYDYLTLMQKTTETLGSIFDAQPSALKGNIRCLTNPGRPVVGYIFAGTVQQKRIFIYRSQIPSQFERDCPAPDIVVALAPDSLKKYFSPPSNAYSLNYTPILPHFNNQGHQDGWIANATFCTNCTTYGGTTVKPSFWPN
ncbi:MAG TPA: DUF4249 domain-containing protein [Puia sp.]|nr:DUF4249 domain-containing protein [Puia sp.]